MELETPESFWGELCCEVVVMVDQIWRISVATQSLYVHRTDTRVLDSTDGTSQSESLRHSWVRRICSSETSDSPENLGLQLTPDRVTDFPSRSISSMVIPPVASASWLMWTFGTVMVSSASTSTRFLFMREERDELLLAVERDTVTREAEAGLSFNLRVEKGTGQLTILIKKHVHGAGPQSQSTNAAAVNRLTLNGSQRSLDYKILSHPEYVRCEAAPSPVLLSLQQLASLISAISRSLESSCRRYLSLSLASMSSSSRIRSSAALA
ncbi:hypothetical protein JZ751_024606 [Albula glossodonta]|uniref:Uncharacterized protein n=1 Tax=Albula glossodonta TaxID=121402 RepID=A0A8T2PMA8_9TELE|nr:hypothetical protein JZ751_024606 [Albula glossodonta]